MILDQKIIFFSKFIIKHIEKVLRLENERIYNLQVAIFDKEEI